MKEIWKNSKGNTGQFFQTQMFIAGIQQPIQKEIMKPTNANFQAVYEAILDLDIIQQDNKAAKPAVVTTVEENKSPLPDYN